MAKSKKSLSEAVSSEIKSKFDLGKFQTCSSIIGHGIDIKKY